MTCGSDIFVCMNILDKYPKYALLNEKGGERPYMLVGNKGLMIPSLEDRSLYVNEDEEDLMPSLVEYRETGEKHSIYVWKTAYSVFSKDEMEWIPVIDSDRRSLFTGTFLYSSEDSNEEKIKSQQMLRFAMISKIWENEKDEFCPIPRFVAELIRKDAISKEEQCPISLTPIQDCKRVTLTSCYHLFEEDAIREWLKTKSTCPKCMQKVGSKRSF